MYLLFSYVLIWVHNFVKIPSDSAAISVHGSRDRPASSLIMSTGHYFYVRTSPKYGTTNFTIILSFKIVSKLWL